MELTERQSSFKKFLKQTLLNEAIELDFSLLEEKANQLAAVLFSDLDNSEISEVVAQITNEEEVTFLEGGTVVDPETFEYWLAARKEVTPTPRWDAYKQLLIERDWDAPVITELDTQSDEIVELLGDPLKEGEWARRGLLLGEVQSGKTANYLGLLNKALDYGYKVIVVIGGHTNELRRQTQQRFDTDLLGIDSEYIDDNIPNEKIPRIGIGLINSELPPNVRTTVRGDFDANNKRAGMMWMDSSNPTVFIIKKNAKLIANVANYIRSQAGVNNFDLPLVVIDDEADWGSPNVGSETDPTRVNKEIRQLLDSSTRSSYVGITATPFANIFIDHNAVAPDAGPDLFPNDFIRVLPAPSNYFGVFQYFSSTHKGLRHSVDDCIELLPIAHKSNHVVDEMPPSLENAVLSFLLGTAIRRLRFKQPRAASMLVNVSRFNAVQGQIHDYVADYLDKVRARVASEFKRPATDRSAMYEEVREIWAYEYQSDDSFSWEEVSEKLFEIVEEFRVELVNSKTVGERRKRRKLLTTEQRKQEDLLPTIFVGGDVLSRGLTLEGLQVSYFVREPRTMDTLMQMARWFGYRPGYEDLVRIWIPEQTSDDFAWAAEVIFELREMLSEMRARQLTPSQFGLRVRTHPEGFKIVAANKAKNAAALHVGPILFENCVKESWQLPAGEIERQINFDATNDLLLSLGQSSESKSEVLKNGYHLWTGVPVHFIQNFFLQFRGHAQSEFFGTPNTQQAPQVYSALSEVKGGDFWDVCLVSGNGTDYSFQSGPTIKTSIRNSMKKEGVDLIKFANSRVATATNLPDSFSSEDKVAFSLAFPNLGETESLTARRAALAFISRPRLLIFTVTAQDLETMATVGVSESDPLIAVGVAFPKLDPEEAVLLASKAKQYMVNSVWLNAYDAQFEGDDHFDDGIEE
jgi:hypothetical protein